MQMLHSHHQRSAVVVVESEFLFHHKSDISALGENLFSSLRKRLKLSIVGHCVENPQIWKCLLHMSSYFKAFFKAKKFQWTAWRACRSQSQFPQKKIHSHLDTTDIYNLLIKMFHRLIHHLVFMELNEAPRHD